MSSSSATYVSKKVVLRSSDGEIFEVDEVAALQSQTIKHMIEDDCADSTIPVPNVTSEILIKIIEYCNRHAVDAEDLKTFNEEFMNIDTDTLYDIIMASNYLNIKSLLDLSCQKFADMIKGKTPDEIREIFSIEKDFTPEEDEEIRRENAWAFE